MEVRRGARARPCLGVWHADGGGPLEGQLAAEGAAGVAGEAHGVRDGGLRGLALVPALHAPVVLALHLHAVLDAALGRPEGPVLQLAHQLGVERRLLGGDGVQVAHAVHVALGGRHVQRGVEVIVQAPDVGTERHQEGQAVEVPVGGRQVERRVPPDVALVRIPPGRGGKGE